MLNLFYDIIILDTGINKSHTFFKNTNNFDSIKLEFGEDKQIRCKESEIDFNGHGTAVSSIIDKYSPKSKKLVINFYELTNELDEACLIQVLEYIYVNFCGRVLNISFGIEYCDNIILFQDVCKKLVKKGFIIVAALGNNGVISYPAAFPEVIGVATDIYITNYLEYIYFDNDDVLNIAGFGINQRLPWKGEDEYKIVSGSSFTCAYFSAIIANLCIDGVDSLQDIKMYLKDKAKRVEGFKEAEKALCKENLFKIKKAILFPFNKEMHSIIRFNDMLNFEIGGVYDSKFSMKIGMDTRYLMTDQNVNSYIIQDWTRINWNEFDTLILGHCSELESHLGVDNILSTILNTAIENNKQIYAFDNIERLVDDNSKNLIAFPKVSSEHLPSKRLNMLYQVGIPSVCIVGTGSQQGKFTLQLELFRRITAKGYDVGTIGTEPSSLIYGMDHIYPLGFNSYKSVFINDYDVIKYINFIMHDLETKKKDLILVASQAGTVPVSCGVLNTYSLKQATFLKAVWPDVVILCVSIDDDIEYIKRSKNYIESATTGKVIAIAFLPFSHKENAANIAGNYKKKLFDSNSVKNIKLHISKECNINVYCISQSEDLDELTNLIEEYFQ